MRAWLCVSTSLIILVKNRLFVFRFGPSLCLGRQNEIFSDGEEVDAPLLFF